jgi:rubrerythrin
MEIPKLLAGLEGVEGGLAELYAWFADTFTGDAEIAAAFYRLSMQERSHLNLVRYGRTLARQTPQDFSPVASSNDDAVEELLKAMGGFRERHPAPTVEDALRFALWAEGHAAERIHRTVIVDANPSLSGVVASLAAADREHRAMLEILARRRNVAIEER